MFPKPTPKEDNQAIIWILIFIAQTFQIACLVLTQDIVCEILRTTPVFTWFQLYALLVCLRAWLPGKGPDKVTIAWGSNVVWTWAFKMVWLLIVKGCL